MSNLQYVFQKECIRCGSKADTFKSAFGESRDALILFSPGKEILDATPPLARMSQYSIQDLISMPFETLFPRRNDYQDLLTTGRLTGDCPLFVFESLMKTQSMGTIPVEIAISPEAGTGDNRPVFQASIRDISHTYKVLQNRKNSLDKENGDKRQKEDKLQSIGALAAGIAHNFNNIMTGVYGNIALARLELEDSSPVIAYLKRAESSMEEAVKLTRQLLTFAKGGTPVKETVEISSHAHDIADFNLSGSNVRLDMKAPGDLWPIHADKDQIGQVIADLVINARQSMETGGTLRIEMENTTLLKDNLLTIARGNYIKFTLTDQGRGIPQKDLERIFDPYFTTKENSSGMGLSICYSIIKKHKGHISVFSQMGTGTSITLYLPAVSPAFSAKDIKENPMNTPSPNCQAKILVMDDEEHIRSITQKMLEKFGYTVELTQNGEEAIAEYCKAAEQGTPFSLVIMDLTIPGGMGGKEASKKILELDPQAKVVISSGYSNDPVMADYQAYGLKGIIPKPFRLNELKETIETLLSE